MTVVPAMTKDQTSHRITDLTLCTILNVVIILLYIILHSIQTNWLQKYYKALSMTQLILQTGYLKYFTLTFV